MADFFSKLIAALIAVLIYTVVAGGFSFLLLVLFSLWRQLLNPPKTCAECGEVFVLKRNKRQILCNKCQKGVMGH